MLADRKMTWGVMWSFVMMLTLFVFAPAAFADDLKAAFEASDKQDWAATERHADAGIKSGDLRGERLAVAYYLRGLARWNTRRREAALEDYTAALSHANRGGELWAILLRDRTELLISMEKWREASADFLTLAQAKPETAKQVEFDALASMIWRLEEVDQSAALSVLAAMKTIGYTPLDPGDSLDYLRGLHVRLLAQRGDTAAALAEIAEITTVDPLVEARIDRRYASLWNAPAFKAATNPAEIAGRQAAAAEQRLRLHPNVAGLVTQYVVALRTLGDFEKAIAIARSALANPSALKTEDEGAALWLRNELVYALRDLGRTDEMFAEMEPVLKLDPAKNGHVVSQLINFAEIMADFGRTAQAVQTAKRAWTGSSPYGQMFIRAIEVCVNATADRAAAERILAEMRKSESDNHAATTEALLCMDQSDDAAGLVKRRLSSPDAREDVLVAVQDYKLPPFVAPRRKMLLDRYRAITARPDVKAEIEKHGRIETFPFISHYWGNM